MEQNTIQNAKTEFWSSKEDYLKFKAVWAKLAKEKKLTSGMMMFYSIVRCKPLDNGFTPTTNKIKLVNGHMPNAGFDSAKWELKYQCLYQQESFINRFEGTFTKDLLAKVSEKLK